MRYHAPEGVTPRLRPVLDALETSPAYVKTSVWDIVAWNRSAIAALGDYEAIAREQRNLPRLIFLSPRARYPRAEWDPFARFAVAAFRADVARAGAAKNVQAMVDELSRLSPEFEAIWKENDVRGAYGEFAKTLRHPLAGLLTLEYSAFAVDGRPDPDLIVYNPATPEDEARIRALPRTPAPDCAGGLGDARFSVS